MEETYKNEFQKKVLHEFLIEMYGRYAEIKSPGVSVSGRTGRKRKSEISAERRDVLVKENI